MKTTILFFLMGWSLVTAAQTDSSLVEARLFLPSHVLKGLSPTQPLTIHYIMENSFGSTETGKLKTKKGKENQYSFYLKPSMYFRLIFVVGEYSAQLFCIDNRKGDAARDYDFSIILEKKRFDPSDLQFMAPCVQREE